MTSHLKMINLTNKISKFSKPEYTLGYKNTTVQLTEQDDKEIEKITEEFIEEYEIEIGADRDPTKYTTRIRRIISITGDDKAIAATNKYVTSTQLAIPKFLFKTDIISRTDTMVSPMLCNYTEGYIMFAPHKNATYDSVVRKYAGSAMPLVFDTFKVKQFLPNTKGKFTKVDLADKMEQAFKQTEWVHDLWIGKPFGELLKIVMLANFDFRNARTFPMLYKTEGGCGGIPPFENLDTLESALHHYKGGRAKKGILKIMEESTLIQKGKLEPRKGVATQLMHLAQTGIEVGKISTFLKDKDFRCSSAEQRYETINLLTGREELDKGILNKSVLIEPDNKFLGAIVAELRMNGFVMTELDVRMAILGRMKFDALLGEKPMGEVLREIEEKKRKEKSQVQRAFLEDLSPENTVLPDTKLVAERYYNVRLNRADISGLSYAGQIRIFNSEDVRKALQVDSFGLADSVIEGMAAYKNYNSSQKHGRNAVKHHRMVESMRNGIKSFIENLPEGVGADDARIGLKVIRINKEFPDIPVFVITNDKGLKEILPKFHRDTFGVSIREYMKAIPKRKGSPRRKGVRPKGLMVRAPDTSSNTETYLYTKEMEGHRKGIVLYDYNNINRHIEARNSGLGYFSLAEAKLTPYGNMPWKDFKKLPVFTQANARSVINFTI